MTKSFLSGMVLGAILTVMAILTPSIILSQEPRLKDILIDINSLNYFATFRGFLVKDGIPQNPPPLNTKIQKLRFVGEAGKTYPLDGLHCTTCVFEDITFEYSGGNFYLDDVAFINSSQIIFKGAAANTVAALALAQWLQTQQPEPEKKPNILMAKLEKPLTVTYGTIQPPSTQ